MYFFPKEPLLLKKLVDLLLFKTLRLSTLFKRLITIDNFFKF